MNQFIETAEQLILFLQKETPEVIQQLFLWGFVSNLIWFVIGIALITSFWIVILKRVKPGLPKVPSYIRTDIGVFCWTGGFVVHLVSILLISSSTGWIKILITPKLYLFEYAVSLIK